MRAKRRNQPYFQRLITNHCKLYHLCNFWLDSRSHFHQSKSLQILVKINSILISYGLIRLPIKNIGADNLLMRKWYYSSLNWCKV
jgi:hypothetical protein